MNMDMELVRRRFEKIGARAMLREPGAFEIDIKKDRRGEYFDIKCSRRWDDDIEAIDVRPDLRHLLLLVRRFGNKDKFLCGHDERHWFVAAVPGSGVSTVATALEALKPADVREAERCSGIRMRDRLRRHNQAFIRQGEWFFVPAPNAYFEAHKILRNEPLSRGLGSKPHMCEEVCRLFGVQVFVSSRYPQGLYLWDYRRLLETDPSAHYLNWRPMQRDATVWARGRVRHPDHKTVILNGWHRVYMNTEHLSRARRHIAFLD